MPKKLRELPVLKGSKNRAFHSVPFSTAKTFRRKRWLIRKAGSPDIALKRPKISVKAGGTTGSPLVLLAGRGVFLFNASIRRA